jgi:tetratricopeptide (TPR) repeat protein
VLVFDSRLAKQMRRQLDDSRAEAEVFFRQGLDLYEKAYFSNAIRELERALERDPDHGLAQEYLRKARRWHEVEKERDLEALIIQLRNRVQALGSPDEEQVQQVLSDLETALRLSPSHEELRSMHRDALAMRHKIHKMVDAGRRQHEGDLDGAVSVLESLVALDAQFENASERLQALRRTRSQLEARYKQAQQLLHEGRLAQARELLENISSISPNFHETRTLLSEIKNREQGEKLLRQALALRDDGLLPEAFQMSEGVLELLPHHVEAIRLKATLGRDLARQKMELAKRFVDLGMSREALEATEQALRYDPHHSEAQLELARLVRNQKALELKREAELSLSMRQYMRAERAIDEALRLCPDLEEAAGIKERVATIVEEISKLYQQARSLAESGRSEGAVEILEKLQDIYPGYREAGRLLRQLENPKANKDGVLLTVRCQRGIDKYVLLMKQRVSIGRHESNDIILEDISTSRHHALLHCSGGGFVIEDLGSKNGTYIAGRQVVDTALKSGDVIDFGGDSKLIVTLDGIRPERAAEAPCGARLTLSVGGKRNIHYLLLYETIHLGSGPSCEVLIQDEGVLEEHARLTFKDGAFTVETLAPQGRVLLGGKEVEGSAPITFGDILALGKAEIYFLDYHY